MTLYEEPGEVFLPVTRPGALALMVASGCLIILSAQFTTLALSLAEAAFANAGGWDQDLWLFAPFADSFRHGLFTAPPLPESYRLFSPLAAVVSLVTALVVVYFWPAQQTVASSLSIQNFGLTLLTFGTAAIAVEPSNFIELERRFEIKPMIWSALVLLVVAVSVLAMERKTIEFTTILFEMDRPSRRLKWWMLRVVPGFALVGAFSYLNDYRAGLWASALTLVITFMENVSRFPRQRFHHLKKPHLREAAIILPILTIPLIAASIYVFGMQTIGRPAQVVSYTPPSTVRTQLLADARKEKFLGSGPLKRLPGDPEGPVIDIRWASPAARPERERGREGEREKSKR